MSKYKCCQTPFLQTKIPSYIQNCLSCNKKFIINSEYICPKCDKAQGSLTMYDLDKDGRTDWTTCNHCDYDEFPVTEFIEKEKVVFFD
jgi:hypothetical protein